MFLEVLYERYVRWCRERAVRSATFDVWQTITDTIPNYLLWAFVLALVLCAPSAEAKVAFTAHLTDGQGNTSRTAYLHWELFNCGTNRPLVAGQPWVIVSTSFDTKPNPITGTISAQVVANDQILCGGVASTQWIIQPMKDANSTAGPALNYFLVDANGPQSFDQMQPTTSSPPQPGFILLFANAPGDQTMNIALGHKFGIVGGTLDLTQTTVLGATAPFDVNGVNIGGVTPNLNTSDPAAGSGFINCTFAHNGGDITLGCPFGSTGSTFAPGSGSAVYLNKGGDTMTGALVLPGDPSADTQAADKHYVDGAVAAETANVVHLSGAENITGTKTFTVDQSFSANVAVGGDLNVAGNINQTASVPWALSGLKLSGNAPTIAAGKDFTLGVGSDLNFRCILSSALGGGSCGAATISSYPNSATGTQCNKLVKLDAAGKAIITAGAETLGVIGVAVAGCGTTGTVQVATSGQIPILFDTASPTVSHYVGISGSSGFVTDSGSTPGSGQNVGRLILNNLGQTPGSCNAGQGCWVQLQLGSSGGGSSGSCVGTCVELSPSGSQTITQPGGSSLNVAGGTLNIAAGGSINGVTFPSSGSNAQTISANNTGGFFVGAAPGTNTFSTDPSYLPLFSTKVAGVNYSTLLEMLANKDVANGYPSLNSNGQVPQNEILTAAALGTGICDGTHVPSADFNNCLAGPSSVGWDAIVAPGSGVIKTLSGPGTVSVPSNLLLTFKNVGGDGTINANQWNFITGPTGIGLQVDEAPVIVAATGGGSTIGYTPIPDCQFAGCALGYIKSTHQYKTNNVALNAAHPMFNLKCTGTNFACPNTASVTGTGAAAIAYLLTIPANTLSSDDQCVVVLIRWKHSTGSASVAYSWNVGGTGSVGGAVTGGTSTSSVSNNGGSLFSDRLRVCRVSGALMTYINNEAWQFSTTQGAPSENNAAINWAQDQQINLMFNVPNTDAVTFWGGEVNYP